MTLLWRRNQVGTDSQCLILDAIVRTIWFPAPRRIVTHGAPANVRSRHRRGEEPKQHRRHIHWRWLVVTPMAEAPWIPGSLPPCYPERFSCRYGLRLPPSHYPPCRTPHLLDRGGGGTLQMPSTSWLRHMRAPTRAGRGSRPCKKSKRSRRLPRR